ncbi:hypothetical protein KBY93_13475 [Synechococcus sp. J7-Johnson]|uniref:hypothetical protein n=1 Tax=Synechococcus sp. J7-Johnson TaxID=2823737 RepID=UPI0020CFC8EC|nr:hypothetical protein [Synechococcus sp. J7-Johnson]MCP9841635.1 hypothetical protein [Synechococcus sp. J7-Johnson]
MSRAFQDLGIISGTVAGSHYSSKAIGSYALALELLRQVHRYLVCNGNGEACGSLHR